MIVYVRSYIVYYLMWEVVTQHWLCSLDLQPSILCPYSLLCFILMNITDFILLYSNCKFIGMSVNCPACSTSVVNCSSDFSHLIVFYPPLFCINRSHNEPSFFLLFLLISMWAMVLNSWCMFASRNNICAYNCITGTSVVPFMLSKLTIYSSNPFMYFLLPLFRYSRGWLYHRDLKLWLRCMEPLVKTQIYERGSYLCFDPNTWDTFRKVWYANLIFTENLL